MATEGDLLRWGVISTANIGVKAIIPAIQASSNGRLVAIASRDLARAESVALRERGARAYGSYQALLDDPNVDAVYVPLPNSQHLEWTVKAAAAGKHVLCEKPLGLTAAEVEAMYDACERAGVLLMEAFMYRFHPQIVWAHEQVAAGRIGPLRMIRSSFMFDLRGSSPDNIRLSGPLGGGSLMDVGCYPLSLCRLFFGVAPERVAAMVSEPGEREVEWGVQAALDFGEGRRGLIDSSFALPWSQGAELIGDLGRLIIPRPFTPKKVETVVRLEEGEETYARRFAPVDQYQLQVERFAECARTGQTPPFSREDALAQARGIEMIYASAGYRWPR
ncbi:MAG TPA: Gfo/Idh/MocA family oxidoreductase [Ktedonobacterales bacterium]|nr:Gfo/Idh/MocA family oxidoreductase [Ktedonobacterales bacterium]